MTETTPTEKVTQELTQDPEPMESPTPPLAEMAPGTVMVQHAELCRICHQPRSEHKRGVILHSFVGESDQASLSVSPENSEQLPPPDALGKPQGLKGTLLTDSVLRLALFRKGVLAVSDLEVIEAELRATGIAAYDPSIIQAAEAESELEVLPPA